MDLKGITWVGHVYQKFEAMCLEVEEVMYQDTVKYVEDQVQTVGASVKKFYSDVMQDLLLPSALEPTKAVAASYAPVEQSRVLKKTNVGLKEAAKEGEVEQFTKDSEVIADVDENSSRVPFPCQLHLVDNIFKSHPKRFVERAYFDFVSGEHNNNTLDKSNVQNLAPAGTLSEAACLDNEFNRILSSYANAKGNHEVSCQQIPTTLTQDSVEGDDCDSIKESCKMMVESNGNKEMEICSSSDIKSGESKGQSYYRKMDTSGSSSSTIGRKEIETVEPLDKTRVDESCIMVNGAELYFHHQREGKHKPYKKKIRDAIYSRMRTARKKEYEQLALWYGDDVKSGQDFEGSSMSALTKEDMKRSLTHDVLDSEWELL
ncbi:hypothetical protein PTKIN_Ptkin08bG0084300 [Pterospermum kingtungense]